MGADPRRHRRLVGLDRHADARRRARRGATATRSSRLGVGSSVDVLIDQAKEFRPQVVAVGDPARRAEVAAALPFATVVDDLADLVERRRRRRQRRRRLRRPAGHDRHARAPASAWPWPTRRASSPPARSCSRCGRRPGAELVPVDSEHCAVHQCLRASADADREVARHPAHRQRRAVPRPHAPPSSPTSRVDQALAHPTWSMGPKITIDSSTLMNKGLEVIEAHELFGVPYDADRGRRPPAVGRPLDGRVHRRRRRSPSSACPTCACRSATPSATRTRIGTPFGRIDWADARRARLRAARPGHVPLPRPRLRGRTGRRHARRPGSARPTRSPSRRSSPGGSAGSRSPTCATPLWTGMI